MFVACVELIRVLLEAALSQLTLRRAVLERLLQNEGANVRVCVCVLVRWEEGLLTQSA